MNTLTKVAYVIIGVYIALYITVLSQYIKPPKLSEGQSVLFVGQWFAPALLLPPLFFPKLMTMLNKLTNVKAWILGGFIALAVCIALQLMSKEGLWWTWSTIGLLLVLVILAMLLTKDRTSSGEGFLLGCSCALIAAGVWEMIYQTGLLLYHDFFGGGMHSYIVVVTPLSTWIIVGAIILLAILNKHKGLIHANSALITSIALFAIFTAIWFANGMYIPLWWYKGAGPFLNDPNPLMMSMIRGSKAFLFLAPAMLFIPRKK